MSYESLIFDIDGTLWDSRALVAEGYNIQLKEEGLEHLFVDADILKKLFGKTMTEIADILLATVPEDRRYGVMERCMEKMGLTPYIQGHLCFGDTGTSKGKTIRILMEKYGIENCAYIGDTQGDYEATVEAGVPFIWASFGFGTPEGYAAKIDAFSDLLDL